MWELDYKESWAPKKWCFWTVVLEKTLESPLDCRKIKHVNPKLATWCEEPTHWKRPWCWERLKAGGEGDDRTRWLDGITDLMDMSLNKLEQIRPDLRFSRSAVGPGMYNFKWIASNDPDEGVVGNTSRNLSREFSWLNTPSYLIRILKGWSNVLFMSRISA